MGFWGMGKSWLKFARSDTAERKNSVDVRRLWHRDVERGDPPFWAAVGVWLLASIGFVVMCYYLINDGVPVEERFSVWWLIGFAFFWTPVNTYINARMSGIAGQYSGVPFIFESAVFISQFRYVNIWFAPLPLANYGNMADRLKETELTRTKFTSLLKVELLIFPLLLIASFIFWSYIVTLGDIPSDKYPYVQMFWPQFAQMKAIWAASMQEGDSLLMEALKLPVVLGAFAGALALLIVFPIAGISTQYIYGGLGAMNGYPHMAVPIFVGACLGRFFFSRRLGREAWQNYAPILAVGFGAGMGLVGMLSIAIHFLYVSVGIGY
jgi:hypothetical protein